MSFADIPPPATPHAPAILPGTWPSQTVAGWTAFETALTACADQLLLVTLNLQRDIIQMILPMSGAFISAAIKLCSQVENQIMNTITMYQEAANQAGWGANAIYNVQNDIVGVVEHAEKRIAEAEAVANAAAAQGNPLPLAAFPGVEASIVSEAKALAHEFDAEGAGIVHGIIAKVEAFKLPYDVLTKMFDSTTAPPTTPTDPLPHQPGIGSAAGKPVDYTRSMDDNAGHSASKPETKADMADPKEARQAQSKLPENTSTNPNGPGELGKSQSPLSSSPPMSSMQNGLSSGGSSGGNPSSSLGSMFKPPQGMTGQSPGNTGSSASGLGSQPNLANTVGTNTGAGTGSGTGASALGRGIGAAASLGSGIADTAARLGTGAVSTGAQAAGLAAQTASTAAASAPATPPQSSVPPQTTGASPMGMVPPAGQGASGPVSTVASSPTPASSNAGPGVPSTPAVTGSGVSANPGASSTGGGVVGAAPPSTVRGVGSGGALGDSLVNQASEAGRSVIESLVGQTRKLGYLNVDWAVAITSERAGLVGAWMASGEGPSYVPLGVRVPADVRLAVTDPMVGDQLRVAYAGGGDPLEMLARHHEMRSQYLPGLSVLAVASSMPMERTSDWAHSMGAKAVRVDPISVDPIDVGGAGQHRCAAASEWDWRQANGFDPAGMRQVAERHMLMACNAANMYTPNILAVHQAFQMNQPISDEIWNGVLAEYNNAIIEYQMAKAAGVGGMDPERAFMKARAAEVVWCLRDYGSVDGFADLLYATRLAGAPLNPAAAVA